MANKITYKKFEENKILHDVSYLNNKCKNIQKEIIKTKLKNY